ncbi:MAG: GAF domain-containing protein [Ardenticatenaceae bacterium]|nr:GAF domain-containing protein [Ardenticatenaceae bacterium]MCB8988574.1 GAF domain-containing protein [Ardenticatenaceae bacterium]
MPQHVIDFGAIRHWPSQLKLATTLAQVQNLAFHLASEQLHAQTAVLSQTAVTDQAVTDFALHLAVGYTGYWWTLTRPTPFLEEEQALAETAVALLATAPFFRPVTEAAQLRFLEIMYGVSEALRPIGPLQRMLEDVQQQILAAFSCSTGYIALHDVETNQITFPSLLHHHQAMHPPPISSLSAENLASWVVANGLPYFSNDWVHDDKPVPGLALKTNPAAVMCVPMFFGDEVMGAISVQSDTRDAFQPADFDILQAIATHVATAVHNHQLYSRAQELVAKGTRDYQIAVALRQAISSISGTLEQEAVLTNLLEALEALVNFETAYVFLMDHQQTRLAASRDTAGRPLDHSPADLEIIWQDHPLLQEMLREKEAILLNNPSADERWRPFPGSDPICSWLGTPLVAGGEVLGALIIQSCEPHAFDRHQRWLASTLAAHTAVALQNAYLYRQTQQQLNELNTLYQASATMTANLDQEFVLKSVVAEMVRALQVDSCTIFVWDRGRQHFIPAAHSNLHQKMDSSFEGSPIIEPIGMSRVVDLEQNEIIQYVLATRELYSLRSDNAHSPDRQALLAAAGLNAALLVPLVRGEDVLGLLALGQVSDLRSFTAAERRLAQNLASQAAIAIEHAHLFAQAQRRVEELATFHNIVLQLNTPLKQSTVLDAITESALKLVDATNLHIYFYDQETGKFSFGSALWRDGRRDAAVTAVRPNGLTATVVQRGEPIIINNAPEHPLFQSEAAQAWGIQAIAGFPLKRGDEVIGAFTITYLHTHTFTKDEILLLNLLADQAAVAVRNARLFDESQRRLRDMSALVDMAQKVTGKLKIRSVLQTTVQILQGLLNARASTITMLTEDRLELVVAAAAGVNEEYMQARMQVDESISGDVVKHGQLVYIRDTYKEPEFLFFSEIVRSLLVVPLIVRGETIGTLTIDSDQPNAFSDSDLQLMTIAAAQVSIAISNAGLFEEVEARAAELAEAYEELKESDRLKDELVQNVSHELRTPLTFVKGYVDLLMDGEMGLVTPEQQDALQIVATKTDEITRLIDDIITLQRIDAGNLQIAPHSLNDLIRTALAGHRMVAEKKGLMVEARLPASPVIVPVDKGRINQVLDNLIANAMKFSPNGGTILVTLEESEKEVRVTVSDQGIGMPKEKQSRIFDRFYQIDGSSRRRFGGTGIGLAIVKRIVDAHQGKIWVVSEPSAGSSFFFTLPKERAAQVERIVD